MNNNVWQDDRPPYEEKKPWWNSRPMIFIAIAIAMVIGLTFLWQALSSHDGTSSGEVPYIAADNDAEKIKPENAGGEEIPHQDKKIYDLIDGSDGKVLRTVAAVENADQRIELPIGDEPSSFSDATSLAPEEEKPQTVYNIQSKVVNITEINDNDLIDNKTVKAEDFPDKKEKTDSLPTNIYRVQMASLPSQKEAREEIKILKGKYDALKGLKITVVPAMVKGKSMYRIHTGPFDTADAANALCKTLQDAGGNCLVVKPSKS